MSNQSWPNDDTIKAADEAFGHVPSNQSLEARIFELLRDEDRYFYHTDMLVADIIAASVDWAVSSLPEKVGARWGSENAEAYRQYQHGFNSAVDQARANLKDSK